MSNISKEKFTFIQDKSTIYDEEFQTKAIGYYQDAWNRFKKNKASLAAAIILVIIMFFALIGPYMKTYSLPHSNDSRKWTDRLQGMPAKIHGLGWIGFDGTKTIEGYPARFERLPEGIVIGSYSKPNAVGMVKATVDFYAYTDYIYTYETDTSLSVKEFEALKDHHDAVTNPNDKILMPPLEDEIPEDGEYEYQYINGAYKVRVKFFKFLEVVYGFKDQNFWFGTTNAGYDLFTEMWKGLRLSLLIAFAVAITNIFIGIIIGSIMGYYGGTLDLVMDRIIDILAGLPFLAILTLLLLRFGSAPWIIVVAFVMTGWIGISSLTRTQFYRYKNREYVLAARTLGAKDIRIMSKHIFPNTIGTLITSLVLYIPGVITSESTYSYLGILNYSGTTGFGELLAIGQQNMMTSFHLLLFPSIVISLLILSFNLFGNGLRDAFNPSLRGVEE